ncbi:hypothetical protein Tco_1163766 [Tanacetum coccineum]
MGVETIVYANSDHAGDYVDRKSTSDVCTLMGCCLTSCFLKKQTALAISTTEAEYVSAKKSCQQALWMKQALVDYNIILDDIPVLCYNEGAIDLSKNPVLYSRTKHIKIHHHFLRNNVQKGNISIEKVSSEDNIADILIKPLKREHVNLLRLGTHKNFVSATSVVAGSIKKRSRFPSANRTGRTDNTVQVKMDDPNITMEEYIRLEEEKSLKHGKVYNWETATYGKIWYDEDVYDLRSVKTEFPAIVFNDSLTSKVTFTCEPKKEFPTIIYNDALMSKLDFSTKPVKIPQHIDEFDLKNETSVSECDEEERNVLYFNDLFSFNVIYSNDSKSNKDNDGDKIDIKQSSGGNVVTSENFRI